MKILQVVHGFPPAALGGVETYTQNLAATLQQRGHHVSVFCKLAAPTLQEYVESEEQIKGISVHSIVYNFLTMEGFASFYRNAIIEDRFAAYIAQHKPDVIHFQHCAGLSATLIARAQRECWPHIVTLHDYWYICPTAHRLKPDLSFCPGTHQRVNCFECIYPSPSIEQSDRHPRTPGAVINTDGPIYQTLRQLMPWPVRRKLLDIYDILAKRKFPVPTLSAPSAPSQIRPVDLSPIEERAKFMQDLLKASPVLTTPSEYVKQAYVDFGIPAEQLMVVPLGIDVSHWPRPPVERRVHGGVRFGYLGGLFEHKGVHLAIQAFRKLKAEQAELRIFGYSMPGTRYTENLRDQSHGDARIRFMGTYKSTDLPIILQGLDVLVIPSVARETYSFVAREATWAGIPVIATRVGALPEVIEHGVNGLLSPPSDVEALTSCLQNLVDHPSLLQAMSNMQALRSVDTLDENTAHLEFLYNQVQTYSQKGV
jgi:glycosyltransferase involved in cell wall biosynthesis